MSSSYHRHGYYLSVDMESILLILQLLTMKLWQQKNRSEMRRRRFLNPSSKRAFQFLLGRRNCNLEDLFENKNDTKTHFLTDSELLQQHLNKQPGGPEAIESRPSLT